MNKPIDYERLRERYRPDLVELLLIGEAPPSGNPPRFFYYEEGSQYDSLYLEVMSVIFLGLTQGIKGERCKEQKAELRQRKKLYLERFQKKGYWLQDAIPFPLDGQTPESAIKDKNNVDRIGTIAKKYHIRNCILMTNTVFVLRHALEKAGVRVLNNSPLPFAGNGHQTDFRKEFGCLLIDNGYVLDTKGSTPVVREPDIGKPLRVIEVPKPTREDLKNARLCHHQAPEGPKK